MSYFRLFSSDTEIKKTKVKRSISLEKKTVLDTAVVKGLSNRGIIQNT